MLGVRSGEEWGHLSSPIRFPLLSLLTFSPQSSLVQSRSVEVGVAPGSSGITQIQAVGLEQSFRET